VSSSLQSSLQSSLLSRTASSHDEETVFVEQKSRHRNRQRALCTHSDGSWD
jgi:hypothetical protein